MPTVPQARCRRGHLRATHSYRDQATGRWCCRACRRRTAATFRARTRTARAAARDTARDAYRAAHAGHDLRPWGPAGRGLLCLTCRLHDDIDPVAVDRAVTGWPPDQMTLAERHAAIVRLLTAGHSNRATAARIGVSTRTVERHRARLATTGSLTRANDHGSRR